VQVFAKPPVVEEASLPPIRFFEAMPNPDYIKKVEIDNKVKVADLEAKVEAKTFKGNHSDGARW
jgi:hypothetical protein